MREGLSQGLVLSPEQRVPVSRSADVLTGIRNAAPPRDNPVAEIVKPLARLLAMGVVVCLTYVITTVFAHRAEPRAPVPEEVRGVVVQAEDLGVMSSDREVDPATGTVRIPIDRAMTPIAAANPELRVPTVPPTSSSPMVVLPKVDAAVPNPAAAQAPAAVATLSPPGSARDRLPQGLLYKAVCQACHDVDGKGTVVRKLMPEIPNFTDSRWHRSRTDAELIHSVTEGKGRFMLSMKDKLSLARVTPKEMVTFVRAFNPSTAATTGAATTPIPRPPTVPTPAFPPATIPAPTAPPASKTTSSAASTAAVSARPAISTVRAPELQATAAFFQTNCIACHGHDGRGTAVRAVMPPLPDFTSESWQAEHSNPQLKISILDGKGTIMPPWRRKIGPELVQNLVNYVRSFGPAGLTTTENPPCDFEKSFDALQQESDDLRLQMKSLSAR
jgi:mono/diheme cytochrome c family protein